MSREGAASDSMAIRWSRTQTPAIRAVRPVRMASEPPCPSPGKYDFSKGRSDEVTRPADGPFFIPAPLVRAGSGRLGSSGVRQVGRWAGRQVGHRGLLQNAPPRRRGRGCFFDFSRRSRRLSRGMEVWKYAIGRPTGAGVRPGGRRRRSATGGGGESGKLQGDVGTWNATCPLSSTSAAERPSRTPGRPDRPGPRSCERGWDRMTPL
ncbi:hypothetical protein HRbin11_01223 [bacterium HR11]|nr:hypothetical protein HRbin11_01223 [bacterium HR11]